MPDFGRWTANGGDPSLNEINRTDRFLDALAFEQPVYATDQGEAELAHVLAGWRDDVRDAPLTAALTPRDAFIALDRATTSRRRNRASLALVGSAAAAVLCLGGFGAVVAGAGPGDTLYGLRTMLFGEQQTTRDDAVVLAAQTQMAEVQQLIEQGQWEAAQDKLQTLTTTVATVDDVEQKQELVSQWQELTVKVESQNATATIPPDAPAPTFPDVPPMVVLDTTTTPSDTTTTSPADTTTPSTPLPTPSTPLPTPSTPLPTPSTPLPTPTPLPSPTPLPTPTTRSPLPTPSPLPTVVTPPPVATATIATPTRVPSPPPPPVTVPEVVVEEPPAQEEPPILLAPPEEVVTTTVVVPEPDNEPRNGPKPDNGPR
jgi:hypothetical protein